MSTYIVGNAMSTVQVNSYILSLLKNWPRWQLCGHYMANMTSDLHVTLIVCLPLENSSAYVY